MSLRFFARDLLQRVFGRGVIRVAGVAQEPAQRQAGQAARPARSDRARRA